MMQLLAVSLLLSLPLLALADCGCGAKCAIYSGADKCTRCCTATVKRSLDYLSPRSSHRFLLPPLPSSRIRIPMWLQPAATLRPASAPVMKHRRHRRPARLSVLDEILIAATRSRKNS